jgi:hypothetical protein
MDWAAECGHLEVVQWLHLNRSEGCTTNGIDGAAANGHLEVVEWLHGNRSEGCTANAMDWAAENCSALTNMFKDISIKSSTFTIPSITDSNNSQHSPSPILKNQVINV